MAYTLPDLGFAFDALEPHIDAQTMQIHHDKHHQAYVDKVNGALEGVDIGGKSIEALLADLSIVPAEKKQAVINNGGGHANHTLFWRVLAPGGASEPGGELAQAINQGFGNFDTLKTEMENAGATRFGSGWAWLGVRDNGSLCITSTPNQDNPFMRGVVDTVCTPILGLDVWEHAYYLNYQNRRPDYVAAWWNVVNWEEVARRLQAAG